ncbi:hypothetical protein KGQ20_06090 [Catenulispora sp. NF23]|uniref:Ferritin-like domain-containing protein n=1 Tax=Catenulispora pinistramenti TaxID=2705254 RepID=A0ABS5KI89_9ACTN|nr:hypothetical protein [Catenulispora pinistramenti]MBS2532338.1 hypothetical protein [Catenulispora pinistramenti]MBS2546107.1 hypothetical protein [Catenulispora pinistramenti]
MTWVPAVLTRRMLLTVTGVALVGACAAPSDKTSPGSSPAKPVPAGQPDPVRDRALAAESDLIARYDAALALPSVGADAVLSAKLRTIRAEHSSHAAAIGAGYTPPPSTPSSTPLSSTPPPSPPAATVPPVDAKTTVATLAKAEQDAASARTTDILSTDAATAMLLASVAASEAGHAALLLGGTA